MKKNLYTTNCFITYMFHSSPIPYFALTLLGMKSFMLFFQLFATKIRVTCTLMENWTQVKVQAKYLQSIYKNLKTFYCLT